MKAALVRRSRIELPSGAVVEMVVWRVPRPLPGSAHGFKYRLVHVVDGHCVLRYDNEAGKGDHRHVDDREEAVAFPGMEALIEEFLSAVEQRENL